MAKKWPTEKVACFNCRNPVRYDKGGPLPKYCKGCVKKKEAAERKLDRYREKVRLYEEDFLCRWGTP